MIKAIVEAAEEARSPVIVFIWEADIEAAGKGYLEAIVKQAANEVSVPVGIHLDHGTSLKNCLNAVTSGHTGVMIDYAHLPFEENVQKTKEVVDICHLVDVFVESELGTVPRTFESEGRYAEEKKLTDPDQAAEFVERTGVDSLAISIGEESGLFTAEHGLEYELVKDIASKTDAYLIMHGGSGTPPEQVMQVVRSGIRGIRFATELRIAFFDTLEKVRKELGHDFPDSRKMQKPAREKVKGLVKERMRQMGSFGKACTDGLCTPIWSVNSSKEEIAHPKNDDVDVIVDIVEKTLKNL
jgi:ketose-bisphosphate aldolase